LPAVAVAVAGGRVYTRQPATATATGHGGSLKPRDGCETAVKKRSVRVFCNVIFYKLCFLYRYIYIFSLFFSHFFIYILFFCFLFINKKNKKRIYMYKKRAI